MNDYNEYKCIYKTSNYSMFSFYKGNRVINLNTKAKLLQSMKEKYLVMPICVNNKFQIIDGQHRFESAKELNLPIYYYIEENYGNDELIRANKVSSTWKLNDYIENLYIQGIEPYSKIKDILLYNSLKVSDFVKILAKVKKQNTGYIRSCIMVGCVSLNDYELNKLNIFLSALEDFKEFKYCKSAKFISAFLDLYFFPPYDHEIMKNKLNGGRLNILKQEVSKYRYLEVLTTNLYSYGSSKQKILFNNIAKELYVPNGEACRI